jgi:hypothetical protein
MLAGVGIAVLAGIGVALLGLSSALRQRPPRSDVRNR